MFVIHIVAVLFGLLLVAGTLPLVLELFPLSFAALFSGRKLHAHPAPDFRLAVVIPAHNEQQLIANCIASLRNHPDIFVVAHNCSDATAANAAEAGARVLILNDAIGGKGNALDFGFQHALATGADAILVLDADSVAGPNLLASVSAAFAAGFEALQCRYEVANANATQRTRLAALAFLGMNVLRPLGRERLGLSCGIFGNGFALSAATLARVPYTSNSLVEDLEYHLHLLRAGIRVRFLNNAAVFGEMPETSAAASSQRARWEGGRILMRRLWSRPLLVGVLQGNLRMLEPLLDLRALPLATEAVLLILALITGFAAHLHWLALYAVAGCATLLLYVLVAASLSNDPIATLGALAAAPGYLAWKLLMLPRTRMAARGDAAWVRTKRNLEVTDPEPPATPTGDHNSWP